MESYTEDFELDPDYDNPLSTKSNFFIIHKYDESIILLCSCLDIGLKLAIIDIKSE